MNTFAEQEVEGTLRFLARETGGTALVNSNRSVALAKTSADVSSYYWLGFTPAWQGDDRSHKVKIEVTRRGPRSPLAEQLPRPLEEGRGLDGGRERPPFRRLPGDLAPAHEAGTPIRKRRGTVEIPMTLGLPAGLFSTVPHDGKLAAQLELRIAASDSTATAPTCR